MKPPFYETVSVNTTEGNNTPKSGAINSFCKSKFANPHQLTGKVNSNHALRWFSVPLLPEPLVEGYGPATVPADQYINRI